MENKFWSLQCVNWNKRRTGNKFYKFIWFRGEEKLIFWILQGVKLKKREENKFLEIYLGIMENEKKIGIYIFFVIFQ